jgi:uncharacterized membrane protein YeaQ/YmgE (transglycosylase-associated protein family)
MLYIIGWMLYGVVVGCLAKALHPGDDPNGLLPTIGIGVAGSFIGGGLSWLLGMGSHPFAPAGIIMGVVGGIVFCYVYRRWLSKHF